MIVSLKIFREQEGKTITGTIATVIAYDIDGPQIIQVKIDTGNASGSFVLKDMQHEDMRNLFSCDLEKVFIRNIYIVGTGVKRILLYILQIC